MNHSTTSKRSLLAFPFAVLVALMVTIVIFVLMYRLIHSDARQDKVLENVTVVEIVEPPKEKEIKEKITEPEITPEEPTLEDLNMDLPSFQTPQVTNIAPVAMSVGDLTVPSSGSFAPPVVGLGASGNLEGLGKGNTGFREVVPAATRQPNVPDMAWENKINGWVLVSFVINNSGEVSQVRVLDSNPRGVFEETVVCAVNGWLFYTFEGAPRQLTQKIELFWKDYPNNIRQQVCS